MAHSRKRSISKGLIRTLKISNHFLKLYPVAVENLFHDVPRERIDTLRDLFPMNVSHNISWKRFGSDDDGGYLLGNDISKTDICISLGIGNNYSFDSDIAEECSRVLMFDHTIHAPELHSASMSFEKIGIASTESAQFTTIEKIISNLPQDADLILKIDVEGAEWEVLESLTPETLSRFRQIAAEFHNLHYIHDADHFSRIVNSLSKISQTHILANFHANNWASIQLVAGVPFPDVVEVTYIRRVAPIGRYVKLENILNHSNNIDLADAATSFISTIEI